MEEINEMTDDMMRDSVADASQQLPEDYEDLEKSSVQGKYHKQSYRKAWESLADFKGWLQGVDGQPNRAFCLYCQVTLFAHRLSLLKHTCTLKHQRASQKALLKDDGTSGNDAKAPFISSISQTAMQQFSADSVKLHLRPLKIPPSLSGNMTVTIIQDETEDTLGLQLGENISEEETNTLITDDDDLGLNTVRTEEVHGEHVAETLTETSLTRPLNMAQSALPLSTHVLDTSKGQPVAQLPVSLYRLIDGRWTLINEGVTDKDGRQNGLIHRQELFVAGRYKLHFDTDRYFELERKETLYPFVEIAFDVHAPQEHYHIPLLLSPFGYSTYRGT